MTDFTIIEAKAHHCGQMVRQLRREHAEAVAKLGWHTHRELRARFDESHMRRAWMIDGKLAAIGGVSGGMVSTEGYVWLAFAQIATRYPVQMVKEARRQIAEIMTTKRRLTILIVTDDDASRRLAIFLGFVPSGTDEEPAASRFGRRMVADKFAAAVAERTQRGAGHAVVMTYQQQEAA